MKIKRNLPDAKAFTLVEVILAATIIGIAAAGLMGCFTGSFFIMRMARENQRATQVLMERAEALRVFTWTQMTNGSLSSSFTDYFDPSYTNYGGYEGVTYHGTITTNSPPFSTSYNNNLLQINLSVTWTTGTIT